MDDLAQPPGAGRGARIVSVQTTHARGGGEYANVDLLEALRARGAQPVLLTNLTDLADGTSVPVRRVDLGPKLGRRTWLRLVLSTPYHLLRLAAALRAEGPVDVTLVHYKKEQLLAAMLPRRLTGRVVWAEWGPLPGELRHGLPRRAYLVAARRAEAILAVAEGTARTLLDAGVPAGKVEVVPGLADTHTVAPDPDGAAALRAEWGAGPETFVVGVVSRFHPKKRIDVVIDALTHLDGDVLLVIAGEGEEEEALRRRASSHGDRVRFVGTGRGWVDALLSAFDVLAYAPSPTEADDPRAVVMAHLAGRPVVSTAAEGARRLRAEGTGAVVHDENDPVAMAELLAAYRDDPERRAREGARARELALRRHDPEGTLRTVQAALGMADGRPA